jgi:hypothetical protein
MPQPLYPREYLSVPIVYMYEAGGPQSQSECYVEEKKKFPPCLKSNLGSWQLSSYYIN